MKERLIDISNRVDTNVYPLQDIVDNVVNKYCAALDNCMDELDKALCDVVHPLTVQQLEDYLLNLNSLIYWVGTGLEIATIKESMSKMIREEKYNQEYGNATGTISDKTAAAKLGSQDEELVRICYSQIVKLIQHKIDQGNSMVSAIKKILTRRTAEMQLGIQQ